MTEGSGAGAGSGSIALTNGSGSGSRRPKNTWIQIRSTGILCDNPFKNELSLLDFVAGGVRRVDMGGGGRPLIPRPL